MKYEVFNKEKFGNIPTAVRNKLNAEVDKVINKQHMIFDIAKCDHSMEKLKYVKKGVFKRQVQCKCGKVYKNT